MAHKHAIWPVLKAVRDELVRTLREGTSDASLERARTNLRGELLGGGTDTDAQWLESRLQSLACYAGALQCSASMRTLRAAPSIAGAGTTAGSAGAAMTTGSAGGGVGAGSSALPPLCLLTHPQLLELIASVRAADVNDAARKLLAGKPALALVGDIAHAPSLEDLVSG